MRAFFAFVLSLLLAAPANAAWFKAETDHFIFYGTSAKGIQADALRLERFDALLRQLSKIPDDRSTVKLTVFVLSDITAVQRALGDRTRNVAGFYTANASNVIAVVPRTTGNSEFEDVVLFHEYAHHLMLHYFPTAYPAWYVEGFAEYLATTQFTPDTAKVGLVARHRAYELIIDSTLPIEMLLTAHSSELKKGQVGNFYGRAWLLTHFLSFAPDRAGQQRRYLNLINEGVPLLDAATQAFGDLKKLQTDLNKYLNASRISYLSIKNTPAPDLKITLTELDKATGDSMIERIQLTRGTTPQERQPISARLRQLSSKYPGNASVLTLLAEAELDLGQYDAASAAADAAIKAEPTNARALLWRGLSLANPLRKARDSDQTKWKTARSWIVKANRANSEDPLPLYEYFQSFLGEGRAPPKVAIDGLGKAVTLIPQSTQYRMPYAFALANQGDYAGAANVLQPIANSPHKGSMTRGAKAMVAKLQEAIARKEAKLNIAALSKGFDEPEEDAPTSPAK